MKVKWIVLIWYNFSFKNENEVEGNRGKPLLRIKRVFMGVLTMVLYQSGFVLYQCAVEMLSTQSH